jgi:outer membrane protein OmpA-like peptidoglycan-associated protein
LGTLGQDDVSTDTKKRRNRRRIEAYALSFSVLAALMTVSGVTALAVRTTAQTPAVTAASMAPWLEDVQAKLEDGDLGFARISLSNRLVTVTGQARNATAKEAALKLAETEIAAVAPDVIVIDNLSVLGGETALGQALASLGPSPTVDDCNAAFARTLEGRFIGFESGSAAITAESGRLLNALTGVAVRCAQWPIEIAGHTDLSGQARANLALSRARAEAVRDYLTARGAAAASLNPVGYGMTQPKTPAHNAAADTQNRRIEFIVRAP